MVLILLHPVNIRAQFISFYSPPYEPGIGGYGGIFTYILPVSPVVSETGMAFNSGLKFDASGPSQTAVAMRWNSSGDFIELPGAELNQPFGALVYAVNATGVAVGWQNKHAIRWELSGDATVLPGLVSNLRAVSAASAINDFGDIAGTSLKFITPTVDGGSRPVRWDHDALAPVELGILGTDINGRTTGQVTAMNNDRTIVGVLDKYNESHERLGLFPVRWEGAGTTATELEILNEGGGLGYGVALGINAIGTSFGLVEKIDSSGRNLGNRAVRWEASGTEVTELHPLSTDESGFTYTIGFGINDAGTVVGSAGRYLDDKPVGTAAVTWDSSGGISELGTLGPEYPNAAAISINSSGIAVGYVAAGTLEEGRAVYWGLDGIAIDLNSLIAPTDDWVLYAASSISDSGWIAGGAAYDPDGPGGTWPIYRPFLLQVPDPTSFGPLLLLSVLAATGRGRRHRFRSPARQAHGQTI